MSQTSASDSNPGLDYSDEEIRCSFSRSPTLPDEDDEDIPCFGKLVSRIHSLKCLY